MYGKPLFSIIVPIYNVEKYLCYCVDSIMSQSYKDFELLLVDDGSPDECGKICDNYAKKDERIRVIHKQNGGLVSARKIGVESAKGKYVAYVDGDDWVTEDWLEVLYSTVNNKFPDIVCFNAYKSVDGKSELLTTSNFIGEYDENDIKTQIIPSMLYDNKRNFYHFGVVPAVWAKVVKTEILKKNLCGDLRITFGEDAACTYGCILEAKSFVGINNALYFYRQNRESMTKAYDKKRFERIEILFQYFEKKIVKQSDVILPQYLQYKVFCIFYAILNEAKDKNTLNNVAVKCHNRMSQQGYDEYLKLYHPNNLESFWAIIYKLIRSNKYKAVILICRLALKVKYSFKR